MDVVMGSAALGFVTGVFIMFYAIGQASNNPSPISVSLLGGMILLALIGLGGLALGLRKVMNAP